MESGAKNDRPELQKAIIACKHKRARLVVAKLDRLSRELHFITGLEKKGVKFTVAEMPSMTESTVNVQLFGAMAEHESKLIIQRTKEALAQAKTEGRKLGNPHLGKDKIPTMKMINNPSGNTSNATKTRISKANLHAKEVGPVMKEMKDTGLSLREIAASLNKGGWRTQRDKDYTAAGVRNIMNRIEKI